MASQKKPEKHEKPEKLDAARQQAHTMYGSAVRLMQENKFEKAKAAFDKLLPSAPPELLERIRTYSSACERQLLQQNNKFESLEERYDYAISLLNTGFYEDARSEFDTIVKKNPSADYAFYGLAVLSSMTCQTDACLQHLTEAIRLNPRNRLQARGDSDFLDMADDPRFTELLYPEIP